MSQDMHFPLSVIQDNTTTAEFYGTNLTLAATPQIANDDNIRLHVNVSYSVGDFAPFPEYGIPTTLPGVSQAEMSALISNGGTTVLGGIMIDDESSNEPREILLFITPTIVR